MSLRKILARLELHRNTILFSTFAGCSLAYASNYESMPIYMLSFGAAYAASLAFRNTMEQCWRINEQTRESFIPAFSDEKTKKTARLYAAINDLTECFELDDEAFLRMETVYGIRGMGGVVRNKHFTPFVRKWAEATRRVREYENALKMIED